MEGCIIKCDKCETDIPEGSQFCNKCGNKIEELEKSPVSKPVEKVDIAQAQDDNKNDSVKPSKENTGQQIKENKKKFSRFTVISLIAAIILILVISIGSFSVPVISVTTITQEPTQVPYQETVAVPTLVAYQETEQVPTQVPYQEAVQKQVDLQFSKSASWGSGGVLDFYLYETVTITNLDTVGGSFTANAYFYDGGVQKTTQTQSVYIGPGETTQVQLKDLSFTYSSDWETRYSAKYDVTPPQKTVTEYQTKYRTEYQTQIVTKYRTDNQNEIVTKYRMDSKTVSNTKKVTLIQYLTADY